MPNPIVSSFALQIGESQADARQRATLIQAEAVKRRQQELSEQSSPRNTPGDRIRIWERLHQVSLPRSPEHRLIGVIATATGLSLEEVLAEQDMRLNPQTTAPAG